MNETNDKSITVLNPVQRKWLGTLSNEQILTGMLAAGVTVELTGYAGNFDFPYNLAVHALNIPLWGATIWYARTHEKLIETVHLIDFRARRAMGRMKYRKYLDSARKVNTLFEVRSISDDGLIRFSEKEWGFIIPCMTSSTADDERERRIELMRKLHDSFPSTVTVHISSKSQIMAVGAVENMITRACPSKRSKKEMELIQSMLEKSRDSKKPVEWFQTIALFTTCTEEDTGAFVDLLQGVLSSLQTAGILAFPLVDALSIKEFYSNDFSAIRIPQTDRLPLLLDQDSIYSNIAHQILPSLIEFHDKYFVVGDEYGTCLLCGVPQGGVSGYPSDLNFSFIEKLYSLSASEKQVVKLDLKYIPVEKITALNDVTNYMDAIDVNISTAKRKEQQAQADKFAHEREKWASKMKALSDGSINEFYGVFIVTILTADKKALDAAVKRVEGLLNSNRISHEIVAGRMKEIFSWTKLTPMKHKNFMKKTTPKLFSDSLVQITPVISSLHPSVKSTLKGRIESR